MTDSNYSGTAKQRAKETNGSIGTQRIVEAFLKPM
jgi:hypothetical protein